MRVLMFCKFLVYSLDVHLRINMGTQSGCNDRRVLTIMDRGRCPHKHGVLATPKSAKPARTEIAVIWRYTDKEAVHVLTTMGSWLPQRARNMQMLMSVIFCGTGAVYSLEVYLRMNMGTQVAHDRRILTIMDGGVVLTARGSWALLIGPAMQELK